jgi:hypothetical protein
VVAMNSDKKVNGEQAINVLLRDISKTLFPTNPVNVPIIKYRRTVVRRSRCRGHPPSRFLGYKKR